MATVLTVHGVDFTTNAVGYTVPVSAGLTGWWYIGTSAPLTIKDLSFNQDATIVGSPVFSSGYASFISQSAYMQTSVPETAELTILAVAKFPSWSASVRGSVVSNYPSGAIGTLIYPINTPSSFPSLNVQLAAAWTAQETMFFADTRADQWGLYVARYGAASKHLQDMTGGGTVSATPSGARRTSPLAFRIGGDYGFNTGPVDMAFCAFYNRQLSDTELNTLKPFIANRLLAHGGIPI